MRVAPNFRWLLVLLATCAVLVSAHAGTEHRPRDTLSAKLFPLAVGDRWVYDFGDQEVAFEVLHTEKADDDATLYVVRRSIGKARVDFKVAVEEDGVYIHQDGAKEYRPPLRQFAFFARTGDEWKWEGTAAGQPERHRFEHLGLQEVNVPAGAFDAVGVRQSNRESGEHATFWLAKEVGVVKVSGKSEAVSDGGPGGGRILFEWTLKKFEPKGK